MGSMICKSSRRTPWGAELKCKACGSDNPDRAKLCVECGGAIVTRCTACNVELPAGAKFCLECAAKVGVPAPATAAPVRETPKHLADKIRQSKAAVEGERKRASVDEQIAWTHQ